MGFSDVLLYRKYFILCRWISCATVHTTDEPSLYHNFRVNKKSSLRKDIRSLEQAQHVFASYFNASYPDCLLVIPRVALPPQEYKSSLYAPIFCDNRSFASSVANSPG
jgi:hypothetical protein